MKKSLLLLFLLIFSSVNYAVADSPPSLTITSPEDGSFVGNTVLIQAELTTIPRARSVKFYIDNILVAEDTTAPYQYIWDTTSYSDGQHQIYASMLQAPKRPVSFDEKALPVLDSPKIIVTVDNSPPTTPIVTDDGPCTTSLTELHASWSSYDLESGITEYKYAVGTTQGGTNVITWKSAGTSTEITLTNLHLRSSQIYYFSIEAINGVGLSSKGFSDGIIVETTSPLNAIVFDDGQYTTSTTQLHAVWVATDPESGIIDNQYSIGTSPGATDVVGWTSTGVNTEVTHTDLFLYHGQIYYFNVITKNDVGMWSEPASSDGIIVNAHLPEITSITPQQDSTFFTGTQVNISVSAQDADGDPLEYRFLVDETLMQDWSASSSYIWTALPTTILIRNITCQVRDDKGGLTSQDINYNVEINTNDVTPPTTPIVTSDKYSNSLTSLHASWTAEDPESGIAEFQYAIGTTSGGTDIVDWTSNGTDTEVAHYGLELTEGQNYYFSVTAINGVGLGSAIGFSLADQATKKVMIKITAPQDNAIITQNECYVKGIVQGASEIFINDKPVIVNQDGTFKGPTLLAPGYARRKAVTDDDPNYIILNSFGPTTITASFGGREKNSIIIYYYQPFVKSTHYFDLPVWFGCILTGNQQQRWNADLFRDPPFSGWQDISCNIRARGFSFNPEEWSYFNCDTDPYFRPSPSWYFRATNALDYDEDFKPTEIKNANTNLTLHTPPNLEDKNPPYVLVFRRCEFVENLGPGYPDYQPFPVNLGSYIINGQSLKELFSFQSTTDNAAYIVLSDYEPDSNITLTTQVPSYRPGFMTGYGYFEEYFSFGELDILMVDLIIDGMGERVEKDKGAEIRINANYDEKNPTGERDDIYYEDFRVNDYIVAHDLNLLCGQLDITGEGIKGKYCFIYPQDKILIWKEDEDNNFSKINAGEFYPVTLPFHCNLRIEAIDGSEDNKDIRIIARFVPDGSNYNFIYDIAYITSIKTKFMLTFDDGPYHVRTERVLSALENFYVNGKRVTAAFFEVGLDGSESHKFEQGTQGSVHYFPDIARKVDNARHIVGNHTQHHQWFVWLNPYITMEEKIDEVKDEIKWCESEIHTALGKEPVKLFRVPYVISDDPVIIGATQLSYSLVWGQLAGDVFSVDIWPPRVGVPPLEEVKDNTKDILEKWNTKKEPNKKKGEPCVLIFHDTSPVTSSNIAEIISNIQDKGFVLTDFDSGQLNTQITRPEIID